MTADFPPRTDPVPPVLEKDVLRKVARRLLPFIGLCYIVLYLDRLNIGVAALTMNAELGISATVFGFAAGVYFWSYTLFEVPSNLILTRLGARRWIARIMITWGLVTMATAAVQGTTSLIVMRVLLGFAEAGFSPGMLYFLTCWFPKRARGRGMAVIVAFIAISGLCSPISAELLSLDGVAGLSGWRWMFIVTGIPAVVLGLVCLRVLPDRPEDVTWLSAGERTWLRERLDAERAADGPEGSHSALRGLASVRTLVLSMVFITVTFALNGYGFWMPQILKTFQLSNTQVGWLGALPPLLAIAPVVLWTRHSDRTGERLWHFVVPCAVGAAGFLFAAVTLDRPVPAMVGFCVAAVGIYTALASFFLLPMSILHGTAAAAGLALINGLGNLGGYFGPQAVGLIKDATGGFGWAVAAFGIALLLGCAVATSLARDGRLRGRPRAPGETPGDRAADELDGTRTAFDGGRTRWAGRGARSLRTGETR
ncbi:MFS transporter [Streptosporangium longisporum]|uniref:MFS transporter n=1 Tax=Streptosporangium longisporum TaxID=46187 RepID=A0ABN3XT11_9ACTN